MLKNLTAATSMQHCTCVSWACWRWPRRATKVREARQRAVLEHLTSTVGPLCGRAAGRDDYRQLPPSKTQMGGEKKQKKTQTYSHADTEALQRNTEQTHEHRTDNPSLSNALFWTYNA